MKQYQYRITLEYLEDNQGNPKDEKIQFTAANHDDIFKIIELSKQREGFTSDMAEQFTVGLKLMGEVMMAHRDFPLFREIKPHFLEIMKLVKGKGKAE
ncbi:MULTISPECIES: DUF3861 domain-containing protein [Basfia]|uniref:DUF3861 domain-containing protein n=2 Tax=Basfia TaxID=697331 RepID=Q65RW2_MANSM|nr:MULTISPECIES: DUF3861 domain-containing protein [Basfia]AAU38298.1 unknown [[Mannheimia] succiniciproducens MBEL55E]QIM68933.1 hypothetical protein A4G13_05790 [Basfia succiniciproducens]SCY01304.1 protein of unknown function [Basfia succiniciproducens]